MYMLVCVMSKYHKHMNASHLNAAAILCSRQRVGKHGLGAPAVLFELSYDVKLDVNFTMYISMDHLRQPLPETRNSIEK